MNASYLQQMRAHIEEGGQLSHLNGCELLAEVERLRAILDTPILEPFTEACVHEARHQVYRWGSEHDATKTAWDWFWTLGYLGGKAAHAALAGDWEKGKHHTVTAGALLANWHRHLVAASTASEVAG